MNITRTALVLLASLICFGCSDPTGGGEKVVERYESGQKKSEGYLLDDGTKVGRWTFWHENGQKAKEGERKNEKPEGVWTSWHDNGQKSAEGEYKNGKKEGRWTYWFRFGGGPNMYSGIYKAGEWIAPLPDK